MKFCKSCQKKKEKPDTDNKDNAGNRLSRKVPSKEVYVSIFKKDIAAINKADGIIALLDGVPCDTGTCIELAYAYAKKKPILGLRTDFRTQGSFGGFQVIDLMTQNACNELCFEPYGNVEILKRKITTFIKSLLS